MSKELAINKLEQEYQALGRRSKYVNAVKAEVTHALKSFCRQSEEFAQAVLQGGSLGDCLEASVRQVAGDRLSDLTAYADAARFFFPGCALEGAFTLHLCGGEDREDFRTNETGGMVPEAPTPVGGEAVVLDLFDLM